MFRPVLITPPAVQPVSPAEAKLHCRVRSAAEDALIDSLIGAAVAHLDGYTGILGRCLISQVWRQDFAGWGGCLRLPFPDVAEHVVTYRDADGNEATLSSDHYDLIEDSTSAVLLYRDAFAAPTLYGDTVQPISVRYTAGYGAEAADVPQAIRVALLLLIGHWYENREAVITGTIASELPMAVDALIAPYRRVAV